MSSIIERDNKKASRIDFDDMVDEQAALEYLPKMLENMLKEEQLHLYPQDFLHDKDFYEISNNQRLHTIDWIASFHDVF